MVEMIFFDFSRAPEKITAVSCRKYFRYAVTFPDKQKFNLLTNPTTFVNFCF
jgi:hypothetical protein